MWTVLRTRSVIISRRRYIQFGVKSIALPLVVLSEQPHNTLTGSSQQWKAVIPTSSTQHPLKATAAAIGAGVQGERRAPRMSHMQSANEGPADIIAKVSGVVSGGKREDGSLYFTNNEGIPFPDP